MAAVGAVRYVERALPLLVRWETWDSRSSADKWYLALLRPAAEGNYVAVISELCMWKYEKYNGAGWWFGYVFGEHRSIATEGWDNTSTPLCVPGVHAGLCRAAAEQK